MASGDIPFRFDGKHIALFGARGGIGSAVATAFRSSGGKVSPIDFPVEGAHLADEDPFFPADLSETGSAQRAIETVWAEEGPIDVMVFAAGVFPAQRALDTSDDMFERVLRINTMSAMSAATSLARLCRKHNSASSAVLVSSGAADRPRPGTCAYSASKAALNALVRGLALELASIPVRVNAVAPGFVNVGSKLNPVPGSYVDAVRDTTPLGRVAEPKDLVAAIAWLAHATSEWVTGDVLHADGGSGLGSPNAPTWLCDS